MNLLQSKAAKAAKIAPSKAGFPAQNALTPYPPPTRVGYEKGNQRQLNLPIINDIKVNASYLSVNRTTRFLPVFCPKKAILGQKMPLFTPKMPCATTWAAKGQIESFLPLPNVERPHVNGLPAARLSLAPAAPGPLVVSASNGCTRCAHGHEDA
jgi:hypothetical protein